MAELTRYQEFKRLALLAGPLMTAQLAQMGMGVTDAVMAGHYGAVDLAGVALAGSLMWPVMMLFMGCLQALTPTISQLNGEQNYPEIGETVRQGIWLALIAGLLAMITLRSIGPVYALLDVDPPAAAISVAYLDYSSLGIPALMIFFSLRCLADGMSFTRPAMIIAVTALLLKIPLNYFFIYGVGDFEGHGGVGAGMAQAIIMWFQLGLIIIVVTRKRFDSTGWRTRWSAPDPARLSKLLRIGLPIGATIFAEMGLFSFTTLLLGRFGSEVVAAHNISMNINGVLFMPPMALGMAATIRIGYRIGQGELLDARETALIAMGGTLLIALIGAAMIFVLNHQLVALYTTETAVAALAAELLLFVVFFLLFDAAQSTAAGVLRGYKDTQIPMRIALLSYWVIGLPVGCALGYGWFFPPMEVYGFWIGLAAGVGSAAILLSLRLHYVSRNKELILALTR